MRVLRRASSPVKLRGALIRDDGLTSPPKKTWFRIPVALKEFRLAGTTLPQKANSLQQRTNSPTPFSGATPWIHDADGSRSLLHCRCLIGCFTRTKCTDPASISLEKLSVKSDAT